MAKHTAFIRDSTFQVQNAVYVSLMLLDLPSAPDLYRLFLLTGFLLKVLLIGWRRISVTVKALESAGQKVEGDSECLKIILFLDRSAGGKRQSAFCFLGQRKDTFMNAGVNLEASLEPRSFIFLVNKWQKMKLLNILFPHLPFEIIRDLPIPKENDKA